MTGEELNAHLAAHRRWLAGEPGERPLLERRRIQSLAFEGETLDDVVLVECELRGCVFTDCLLRGLYAPGSRFEACRFTRCDLRKAQLNQGAFPGSRFEDYPDCQRFQNHRHSLAGRSGGRTL